MLFEKKIENLAIFGNGENHCKNTEFENIVFNSKNVKKGAILLDVGISSDGKGIQGDVDFNDVDGIASAVTPMPGGTGPMTVACLLENTMKAAELQGIIPKDK